MQALRPDVSLDEFYERLRHAPSRALMLDYDGTLAPFRADRERALPYPEVIEPLNRILQETDTRVALISGRAIADLLPLVSALCPRPQLWGCHGWEMLDLAGRHHPPKLSTTVAGLLRLAESKATSAGFLAFCEQKPTSIALHWRGRSTAQQEESERWALRAWRPLAEQSFGELELHGFDGGVELRAIGRNKGDAVKDIVGDLDEGAVIAYAGDDQTDEDAFRVLRDRGLCLLVRGELRPTLADIWLRPPPEFVDFLTRWRLASTSRS